MTEDARFEDAHEAPLHLKAEEADDVPVISALLQDAVFLAGDMLWEKGKRRFALLLNRFRWEDAGEGPRRHPYERVRALLVAEDATGVASQGIDRSAKDTVLSLLSLAWEPGEDGIGRLILTLAGDGAVAVSAECLNLTLKDVTRPYAAPSGKAPAHPE
jgi:hypothetical protein